MDSKVKTSLGRLHQCIAVLTCSLIVCVFGIGMVWVSYSIRMLSSTDSPLGGYNLTDIDKAMLGSLPNLGGIIASVPAGGLIQMFGTKKCGIAIGIMMSMAWFLKIISKHIYLICAARLLLGISGGFGMMNITMFLPDVAETAIRGTLSTSIAISITTGMLISYILGASFEYRVINMIVLTIPVMYTVGVCFIHDSPVFLLKNKKEKEAAKSMAWYRGASVNSQLVIESLDVLRSQLNKTKKPRHDDSQKIHTEEEVHKEDDETERLHQSKDSERQQKHEAEGEITGWKYMKTSSSSRRALLSTLILFLLQSCMGFIIVTTFAGEIIRDAAPSLSPDACSILIGVFTLLGTIFATFAIERTGRKMLLIITSLVVAAFLVMLAVLVQTGLGPGWLPAAVLCVYVIIFSLGPGTVPFVWSAEMFLPEVRGFSTAVVMQTYSVIVCVCLALFPPLKSLLGLSGMFYVFSGFCLITATFTFFVFPETRGLTVEEIHVHFGAKRKPQLISSKP